MTTHEHTTPANKGNCGATPGEGRCPASPPDCGHGAPWAGQWIADEISKAAPSGEEE